MAVQLYTMRIVLNALGDEDYGIYNVVAGAVVLFNFLTVTMSGATSRFLTYEMGAGDIERLKATFRTALFLHICIAVILLILAETAGLWFVTEKLVIPENRMSAAQIVYQFAILTIIIKTIQVPFNASIISNERMGVYAKIEIINVFVILGGVYCLQLWAGDKLVFYATLLTVVAAVTTAAYSIYCIGKFPECSWNCRPVKSMIRPLLSFSGWDLYGNFCVTARIQGLNIVLNLFFGPIVNAAAGISASVQGAIISFGTNVITAFRPQIIKQYASGQLKDMETLMGNALKYSLLLFALVAVPLYIEMPFILKLWLKNPPEYSVVFTRISLLTGFISFITSVLNIAVHATGQIKWLSIISGTMFLLILPLSYIALYMWHQPEAAYIVTLIIVALNVGAIMVIVCRRIPEFNMKSLCLRILIPTVIAVIISAAASWIIRSFMSNELLGAAITIICSTITLLTISVILLIPRQLTKSALCKMREKLH